MASPRTTRTRKDNKPKQVYVATDSGAAQIDPEDPTSTVTFVKGKTRISEDNPLLRAAGHAFEPVEDHLHYEDR